MSSTRPPRVPRLLAISDRRSLAPGRSFDDWLHDLAAAWLAAPPPAPPFAAQIREKDLDDRSLLALVRRARSLLPPAIALSVNGRLDIALAAGADGVHLPAAGLPLSLLRRHAESQGQELGPELGRELLLGRSTHSPAEVQAARDEGADYVSFGPVYPTPSKARYGPPPGLEGLTAVAGLGVPILALGGVTPERLPMLAAAGAHGAAAIRAFHDRDSTAEMFRAAATAWR